MRLDLIVSRETVELFRCTADVNMFHVKQGEFSHFLCLRAGFWPRWMKNDCFTWNNGVPAWEVETRGSAVPLNTHHKLLGDCLVLQRAFAVRIVVTDGRAVAGSFGQAHAARDRLFKEFVCVIFFQLTDNA